MYIPGEILKSQFFLAFFMMKDNGLENSHLAFSAQTKPSLHLTGKWE